MCPGVHVIMERHMVHISKIVPWSPNSHAGLSPVSRTHCVFSSILHLITATICDPQNPTLCIAIRMVGDHSTSSSSVMLRWGNLSPELKERCLLFSHHFAFILLINHLVFHQWWEEMENHFLPASWTSRRSSSHTAGQTKIPSGDPLLNPCPPTAERSASPSAHPTIVPTISGASENHLQILTQIHHSVPSVRSSFEIVSMTFHEQVLGYSYSANQARLVQALGTLPTSRNFPLWTSVFSSVKWDHPAHYPGPCEDTIRWFTLNIAWHTHSIAWHTVPFISTQICLTCTWFRCRVYFSWDIPFHEPKRES